MRVGSIMTIRFEAIDPLGRSIFCTEDRWIQHILYNRHWTVEGRWQRSVTEAITAPTFIFKDSLYEDRICYYRRPPGASTYMKVVVQLITDQVGEISTAMETNGGKKGEILIWPISKS
jgi:hypothetical protein